MPPARKRRRESEPDPEEDYEESDVSIKRSRNLTQDQTPDSQQMANTQIFAQAVTKTVAQIQNRSKKGNSYVSSFRAKVEKDQGGVITAVDAQLDEGSKKLESRKSAAGQLLACVTAIKEPNQAETHVPDYLKETKVICEELATMCQNIVASYQGVIDVISEQADAISFDIEWPEQYKQVLRLLSAGAKHTLTNMEGILGPDEDSSQRRTDFIFDVDDVTSEDLGAWEQRVASPDGNGDTTLAADTLDTKVAYGAMVATVQKQSRRWLKIFSA